MQQLGHIMEIPLLAKKKNGEEERWFDQNHYMHH
jgi:hypothetical protein